MATERHGLTLVIPGTPYRAEAEIVTDRVHAQAHSIQLDIRLQLSPDRCLIECGSTFWKRPSGPKVVHVAVDGAFISEVVPAIARTGADYVLPTNAAYTLKLRNLLAGSTVTIRSWRKEGDKEVPATPATLLVLRGEEKPESTKK